VVPFVRAVLRGGGGLNNFCVTLEPERAIAVERRDGGGARKRAPNAAGQPCAGQPGSLRPSARARKRMWACAVRGDFEKVGFIFKLTRAS
jgi:hypothetical protein